MAQIDISPRELRRQLVETLKEVNAEIEQVKVEAARVGLEPRELRVNGGWVMIPLLATKAQCLTGIAMLQGK